jgi:hypothetical protein
VCLLLLGTSWLHAATFVVDRFGDSATHTQCQDRIDEDCSLRGAIIRANQLPGNDIIEFDLPSGPPLYLNTIYLSVTGTWEDDCLMGDLDITDGVRIDGGGLVQIDASQLGDRVLEVHPFVNGEVTLTGLKIQGGELPYSWGGGFSLGRGSTLVLERTEVRDNTASWGAAGRVFLGGQLWIVQSTLTGNQGDFVLMNGGEMHITNSTISGNSGVVVAMHEQGTGLLWLDHATIADNDLGPENHVIRFYDENSVFDVAGSVIEGACMYEPASVVSSGGSVESPGNTCGLDPSIDLVNVADPCLWPLGYYGGVTRTLVPNPRSPVVDDPLGSMQSPPAYDQRGLHRPADGNGDGLEACDAGAAERQAGAATLMFDGFESGTTLRW